MARPLLTWQQEALDLYLTAGSSGRLPERFLVAAFPGMGKTELTAAILAETGRFGIILVAQADTLTSWRATLHGRGVCPAVQVHRDAVSRTCTSCGSPVRAAVMTYDFAAANPSVVVNLFAKRGPILLVCDEIHHLRHERAWASPIVAARPYVDAVLALSATPFRTDEEPVPFVHTEGPWTRAAFPLPERCIVGYNYRRALTQKPAPVNRAVFERYDADVEWMEDDGDGEVSKSAVLSENNPLDLRRKARRHSLNPRGAWLPKVLLDADATLMSLRATDARAGGLVVCRDTDHAVAVADLLAQRTDGTVTVYTQDYSTRTHRLGEGRRDDVDHRSGGDSGDVRGSYEGSDAKWMVTVRKVSEGVDIPRLRVLVYATVTRTELFFVQVLGRVIRVRRDLPDNVDQTAWVFIPDDPEMRRYAEQVENSIADAEIAAYEDEEPGEHSPRDLDPGCDTESTERFVSADPSYAGATASGEVHEAELMALLRQIGETSADSLAMLRKLRDGGHLNVIGGTPLAPVQGMLFDPVADLGNAKKEKNNAANSWAGLRLRAGEFQSFGEAITACHNELGDLFGVWRENADVTVEQVTKAKRHAQERVKDLRRG